MTELEPRVTRYLPATEHRRFSSMFCHSVTRYLPGTEHRRCSSMFCHSVTRYLPGTEHRRCSSMFFHSVTQYLPGTEYRRCSSMFCHSVTICLSLSHYPWMPHFAFKMCHFTSTRDIQLSLLTAFCVSRLLALLDIISKCHLTFVDPCIIV
jgi:hypothetical protein